MSQKEESLKFKSSLESK